MNSHMKNNLRLVAAGLMFFTITTASAQSLLEASESTTPVVQNTEWAKKWWKPRHEEKLKLKAEMGQVDLVFLGDSITHRWEEEGKRFWKKYYGSRKALNLGFRGDSTEHVLWRLKHGEVDGINPKLVVLMIGTNNAGERQEKPELTARGIKAILDDLKVRLPDTKILLLAIFPRGSDDTDPKRQLNMATNKMIEKYADNKRVYCEALGLIPRRLRRLRICVD